MDQPAYSGSRPLCARVLNKQDIDRQINYQYYRSASCYWLKHHYRITYRILYYIMTMCWLKTKHPLLMMVQYYMPLPGFKTMWICWVFSSPFRLCPSSGQMVLPYTPLWGLILAENVCSFVAILANLSNHVKQYEDNSIHWQTGTQTLTSTLLTVVIPMYLKY